MTGPESSGEFVRECCDACLRRALLIATLAPRLEACLESRERNPRGVLALPDDQLVAAVAGDEDAARLGVADPELVRARHAVEESDVHVVCMHAERYPDPLHQLGDAPACLFLRGRAAYVLAALARTPAIALVGTRRASPYGLEMAHALGRGLGAAQVPVVSGLALGVDAAAHEGCLAAGGVAVAVLAGGVDVPYPRTNRRLYDRIVASGAVVSEMPPGRPPFRWAFPARNRIMAALAEATCVVEAAQPSGSLITSDYATDLGRLVAAVPGQATNRVARGSNDLLRHGAAFVTEPRDLLEELFGAGAQTQRDRGVDRLPPPPPPPHRSSPAVDGQGQGPNGRDPQAQLDAAVLEGVEKECDLDEMRVLTGAEAKAIRGSLARLEAGGLIRRDALGRYVARALTRGT